MDSVREKGSASRDGIAACSYLQNARKGRAACLEFLRVAFCHSPTTRRGYDMKRMLSALGSLAIAAAALGADKPLTWPQFRGPGGSGVADDQKPPIEIGP